MHIQWATLYVIKFFFYIYMLLSFNQIWNKNKSFDPVVETFCFLIKDTVVET